MRLHSSFGIALVVLAVGCQHDDVTELISRDGQNSIPAIDLTTSAAGGVLTGTRATNRFLSSGVFDTAITDAFSRATTNPPDFITPFTAPANCGFYGPLIYAPRVAMATFTPPHRYLPALVGTVQSYDGAGCNSTIAYIAQPGNAGNGAGNTIWEFWYDLNQLGPQGTRYVMGLARYALEQRGALDISELLLSGAVTQPDSLVFRAGDFAPAGKKAADVFTTNCASLNIVQPVSGANPHFLASDTANAASGIDLDQTVCANAASAWGNLGTAKSPLPTNNNTALGVVQYNFFVVWEALADSTPDYSKPVYRQQIGPLLTTTGTVVNNSYGPIPAAALSTAQLALLPGATASPDTIRVTANGLVPLAAGNVYQVWITTATGIASKVTGRVVRLSAGAVVDTVPNVSEFNLVAGMDAARMEFDFFPYRADPYNAAVVTVTTAGAATLPASQPLWTTMVTQKLPGGAVPSLSSTMSFGSYNGGSGPRLFGFAGSASGGIFGTELREDVLRIPRPPVGYQYEGWLVSSTGANAPMSLGPILSPYPDLVPLTDADVSTDPPLSGVEITRAAVRHVAADTAFFCAWDRVQVRLAPKVTAGSMPPTILLSGINPRRGC